MLGRGTLAPEQIMMANQKMEGALEDLRIKYEKINAEKEAAAEKKAKEEYAKSEEGKRRQALIDADAVDMQMEDDDLEALRQRRMEMLKNAAKQRQQNIHDGHGEVREITEEEFLREVTSTQLVIVHFYHEEFLKCKVMDKHLRELAPKVHASKFLRIDANKAPFFVNKLKVRVLPSLIMFRDGVMCGRQTGFEDLVTSAADQDFPSHRLLRVFAKNGMCGAMKTEVYSSDEEDENQDEEDYFN